MCDCPSHDDCAVINGVNRRITNNPIATRDSPSILRPDPSTGDGPVDLTGSDTFNLATVIFLLQS